MTGDVSDLSYVAGLHSGTRLRQPDNLSGQREAVFPRILKLGHLWPLTASIPLQLLYRLRSSQPWRTTWNAVNLVFTRVSPAV